MSSLSTEATTLQSNSAQAQSGASIGEQYNLNPLFSHLCSSSGLYSKETFYALYSCLTRLVRDRNLDGLVLTRPHGHDGFEAMAQPLEGLSGIELHILDGDGRLPVDSDLPKDLGFLSILSDKLCAFVYWRTETDETFRLYEGGWTFHPADTKTMTRHLTDQLHHPEWASDLDSIKVDRRYDEKLTLLTTSLVHSLENRNRELMVALDRVNALNKQVVEHERLAAIGQLCSVIAHEIRNPLGLIDLYAKLAETQVEQLADGADASSKGKKKAAEPPPTDPILKNIGMIRQATENLESILSELTQYSRPLQLQCSSVDLVAFVNDVCEFYRPSFEENAMTLAIENRIADGGSLFLDMDQGRMRQCLINLLKNALEASKDGSTVTVTMASRKRDNRVYIKVSDEGCGIKPEALKKLFTPYFSTKSQGTGLGLAQVRKILQAHGGNAELLNSTPGEGSTFALILPRKSEDPYAEAP